MKTKTLLIAAAALAAGVMSSQAQVYSQNIVGYVNVVLPGAATYSMVANPLNDGNGNQLTNILASLPNSSQVLTWGGTSYNGAISLTAGIWSGNMQLPPGVGFFVKNGKATSPALTNTFVGSVACYSGQSVTNTLNLGYNMVGSVLPYAGDLTTDTNLNLQVPNSTYILTWPNGGSSYNAQISLTAGVWSGPANVTVGQGYFIHEGKYSTNWVQTLH